MELKDGRWDRTDAEIFVGKLFSHVLRRDLVTQHEITNWTNRAVELGDPLLVFNEFVEIQENKDRQALDIDTQTRWPAGHFYSPIGSRSELTSDSDRIFAQRGLLGIDMRSKQQLKLFRALAPFLGTIPFCEEMTKPHRYYYNNPSYNYGDAVIYWAMLNHFRPRRIIEVGCGFSSALALDTIDQLGLPTVCTFVDPYPAVGLELTAPMGPQHRFIAKKIQDIDPDEVKALEAGDLLFIDSSHVLKTGSDVYFELTELLPRLKPGVLVHFHDTFDNFEYPRGWAIDDNHSWNEVYALHLFLLFNGAFQIEYFNDYVAKRHASEIRKHAADQAERILLNPGGGLWLRRV